MNLHPKKLFPEVDNIELLNHQVVTKKDLLNFEATEKVFFRVN